jgi:hypothetical protein
MIGIEAENTGLHDDPSFDMDEFREEVALLRDTHEGRSPSPDNERQKNRYYADGKLGAQKTKRGRSASSRWALMFKGMQWHVISEFNASWGRRHVDAG